MNARLIPLALALDLLLGDPPNRFHPVAWMGSLVGRLSAGAKQIAQALAADLGGDDLQVRAAAELAAGSAILLSGAAVVGGLGLALTRLVESLPNPWRDLALAYLLKTTISLRGLDQAAGEVQSALESGNLAEARRALAWHLVSRDTSQLDAAQVAAAAIESVAENTSDGVIAPLFYAWLGGPPAALLYRLGNTADAMLGYHTSELEWLGKVPARLDDLLNLFPARLTGLLICLASLPAGGRPRNALAVLRRDARQTESPNAGYPMSAMAGGLGVELEKVGQYRLGTGGRQPGSQDIQRARQVMLGAAGLGLVLVLWQARQTRG